MPYLNLDFDFFDHPKTLRMIGILGPGGAEVAIRLWAKVGKFFARTGVLHGHSVVEIEALIGWWGKPGDAVAALEKVGFIERHGDSFAVHDWKHHQGHIHALKMRNRKVAINRWGNINGKRRKRQLSDGTSGTNMVYQNSNPGVPLAVPFLSNPDHNKREDIATPAKLFKLWNDSRPKELSEARGMGPDRIRHAKARIAEEPSMKWWSDVVAKISTSQFLLGHNDRGWKASFDFILSPGKAVKILEGAYECNGNKEQSEEPSLIIGPGRTIPGDLK